MQAREELLFCVKSDDFVWNTSYTEEKSNRKDLGANGKPRKNEFKRCSDVWIDIAEASQSSKERFHYDDGNSFQTVKPYKAAKRIIECASNKNDLIYFPIFWWSKSDKIEFESTYNIKHSDCYESYGLERTGCAGCPFNKNFDEELEIMRNNETKLYKAATAIFGESYNWLRKYQDRFNRS